MKKNKGFKKAVAAHEVLSAAEQKAISAAITKALARLKGVKPSVKPSVKPTPKATVPKAPPKAATKDLVHAARVARAKAVAAIKADLEALEHGLWVAP